MASFAKSQMQDMVKQQMKEQGLEMARKMMVKGIDAATQRIRELKAAGKLNQMSPELKASIRKLCAEAPAQFGGKKTRKHKGKKSTKKKRRKHHKKTHKKRK